MVEMLKLLGSVTSETPSGLYVVTTMWDRLCNENAQVKAETRLAQLNDEIWKDLTKHKTSLVKFLNTHESALDVLSILFTSANYVAEDSTMIPGYKGPEFMSSESLNTHLYRDLVDRILNLQQQKRSLEGELGLPETQKSQELKMDVQQRLQNTDRLLTKFEKQLIGFGDPPKGFERANKVPSGLYVVRYCGIEQPTKAQRKDTAGARGLRRRPPDAVLAVWTVRCAPGHDPHATHLQPNKPLSQEIALPEPNPKIFKNFRPHNVPAGLPIQQAPELTGCDYITFQDRRGPSSIGELKCRRRSPEEKDGSKPWLSVKDPDNDSKMVKLDLVKVYPGEILDCGGSDREVAQLKTVDCKPRLRLLWELEALMANGLLDKWEYKSLIPETIRHPTLTRGQRVGNVYIHYRNLHGVPLRGILHKPDLIWALKYRRMPLAERLALIDQLQSALCNAMEANSNSNPLALYNPGLNLGNVYFNLDGPQPVVQLPEWGWSQHRVAQKKDNDLWVVDRRYTCKPPPGTKIFDNRIQKDVHNIFAYFSALAHQPHGGLGEDQW
ncbi:hypothetical protein CVT24_000606 [Panaeolus cyanescens]|uniref:Uncharacterized protein n=1 Tax=Panaeolus cyanescens TaxID=181874 RepID=A0A409YT86_9AGAR|nr:hypothetical protein CVT24_000606 [Panaeolus cyanescens]